jgi:ABC-2 type transport system ATP-binding protein
MLQRLGLAQALINDPDVLFLDEPTDGIDPVGRREVRDILLELRNQGKTIFLNSHLLSEVERVSDEVAILKEGKLIEKGNVQQFISMKHTYQIQFVDGQAVLPHILKKLDIKTQENDGTLLISVSDEQQLNQFIDQMRKEKVLIQAIIPYKVSLEDFFIKVLEDSTQP